LPYHRIPRARLHEDITAIEREGERVTSCTLDGGDAHVFTCYIGERPYETRAMSVARTVAARHYACNLPTCDPSCPAYGGEA
jgi:hypothetical protein